MNTEHTNQSAAPEPFGYFKAEPFGWTDCEKDDEGAIALYERPQAQPVARDVLMMALQRLANEVIKFVPGGSIVDPQQICDGIRQIDLATIADHYAARLPVEMHSTGLNDRKAAEIIQTQGFTATGYVLTGQDGRYALCNGGAVRWLDKAEYQHTMFPEGRDTPVGYFNGDFSGEGAYLKFTVRAHGALPPSGAKLYTSQQPPVPVPSCPNQYGLDTPYFASWLNRVIPRLDYYRPDDFARELGRMAAAADKTALLQDQLSGAVAQEGADK